MNKSARNKFKARQCFHGRLAMGMLALVAVCLAIPTFGVSLLAFAPIWLIALMGVIHKGVMCATFGLFTGLRVLRDKAGGEGNGAFEKTVLDGVKTIQTQQEKFQNDMTKVMSDLDRLDKEGKKAMEDLTLTKNKANTTFEEVMAKMEKVQKQIVLNTRSSFRSPIARALANEEFRFKINAFARYIIACKANELGKLDPAHKKVIEDAAIAQKALTGVDAGLGQATVPIDTFNEIYDLLLEYGDYSTLDVKRVGARTNVLPLATGRPQFAWMGAQSGLAEGSQIPSGSFGGGDVVLIIQTLGVLMYISRELLQDSTVDLAPYVVRQMIQSIDWGLDTACFIGTGNQDTTNGGYVGLFNAALSNTNLGISAGAGRTSVGLLKLDDFVAVQTNVSAEVLKRKPMWWMHPQMIARAVLIRDAMGRPIFQTWQEVPTPGAIGSILGAPVHPTAVAPNTDGANQPVAAFGDPDAQPVGVRADLELATSADIGFPQNLMAYRALFRAGVKMYTQPGSVTLKPFTVLSTSPQ